jgi:hypothetical protein
MPGIQLSAAELAALDVVIATMKSKVGSGQAPGGFIGDIINITHRIIDATRVVVPVVQATTQIIGFGGPGSGPGSVGSVLDDAISNLPSGVTLDQLVQYRANINRT